MGQQLMAVEGVDYAFTHEDPAQLYAAGKRFAMRYVGPGTDDKHLHADERDAIWAAGLSIVLLVEGTSGGALGGRSVGVNHAQQAEAARKQLGAPPLPLYFAIDIDATAAQWPACREYLRGAGDVIGPARVGVYGGLRSMQWADRDGVAAWFFQTYAWSGGQWFDGNNVEQYRNGVALAGGIVDLCRAHDNFGQWEKDMGAAGDDVWTWVVTSPSLGYSQPAAEYLKYTVSNSRDIAALAAKVDQILAALATFTPGSGAGPHTHEIGPAEPIAPPS